MFLPIGMGMCTGRQRRAGSSGLGRGGQGPRPGPKPGRVLTRVGQALTGILVPGNEAMRGPGILAERAVVMVSVWGPVETVAGGVRAAPEVALVEESPVEGVVTDVNQEIPSPAGQLPISRSQGEIGFLFWKRAQPQTPP